MLPDNDELIYGGLPGFICTGKDGGAASDGSAPHGGVYGALWSRSLPGREEEEVPGLCSLRATSLTPLLPAGLLECQLPEEEAKCCEVQWDSCDHPPDSSSDTSPKSTASESLHYHHHDPHLHHQRQNHYHLYHHHQYHHSPSLLPVSAGSRLGSSRIRLCVLVLMLLHTMVSFSSVHSGGGGLGPEALPSLDESVARDE